ncbi:hypothetical protein HRI_002158600 [Hibiscus trionum]|uniref:Endonuclease/exonuclease/phosphatase domain-containing protein n=1 Tax=Hibiscus trionum TaxID=183268 RepID=A0A9W7HYB2_HIBTR|nr:hypothetical protein HRI_002158600 [Hibiscus trionum]
MNSGCLVLSWIVRGLGKFKKKAAVRKIINSTQARVIFIQETKLMKLDGLVRNKICGKSNPLRVIHSPSNGGSGGIMILWDSETISISQTIVKESFIGAIGHFEGSKSNCFLINVYLPNDSEPRMEVLEEIIKTTEQINLPVIIGGDFNIIREAKEKSGPKLKKKDM